MFRIHAFFGWIFKKKATKTFKNSFTADETLTNRINHRGGSARESAGDTAMLSYSLTLEPSVCERFIGVKHNHTKTI